MKDSVDPAVWQLAQTGHLGTWVEYAAQGRAHSPERARVWRAILAAVERTAPVRPGERVLDIGCGLDTVLDFMPGVRGVTLDSLTAELSPLGLSPRAAHTAGVFERLPFRSGAFDRVFLMNVLDHVLSPSAGLGEIARVTAPGGILVLSVDTYSGLRYYEKRFHKWWARTRGARTKHPWAFSNGDVRRLLARAGFDPGPPPRHCPETKARRQLFVGWRMEGFRLQASGFRL